MVARSFPEDLRFGDHICHFFDSQACLVQSLVPYFKAGLERGESCVWVANGSLARDRALSVMRSCVADFDRRANAGQMRIFDHREWFLRQGSFDAMEGLRAWMLRKEQALAQGYAGLRVSGDVSFLDDSTWRVFQEYEQSVDVAFRQEPIVSLCCYSLDKCSGEAVEEVKRNHWLSLLERDHRRMVAETANSRTDAYDFVTSHGIDLQWILHNELAPICKRKAGRFAFDGLSVRVSAGQARVLGRVFRELALNATRFGALASPGGVVNVAWRVAVNGTRRLRITWAEGTAEGSWSISDKVGHGTLLLARVTENFVRVFEGTGMKCSFEVRLDEIENA